MGKKEVVSTRSVSKKGSNSLNTDRNQNQNQNTRGLDSSVRCGGWGGRGDLASGKNTLRICDSVLG